MANPCVSLDTGMSSENRPDFLGISPGIRLKISQELLQVTPLVISQRVSPYIPPRITLRTPSGFSSGVILEFFQIFLREVLKIPTEISSGT